MSVEPASASVFLGGTQQFQAAVTGSTNISVTWEVNGVSGGSASAGTISVSGLYTAPAALPFPASVTVTAVSQADAQAVLREVGDLQTLGPKVVEQTGPASIGLKIALKGERELDRILAPERIRDAAA